MSISIDQLRAASRLDHGRLQADESGNLEKDTRRPGLFSFGLKRDIGADNRVTAGGIKQALCEHYGRARGESLFSQHIGGRGRDISSVKLRALLEDGDRRLLRQAGKISEAMRAQIRRAANLTGGEPGGLRRVEAVMTCLIRGGEILSQEPLNQPEISQSLAELEAEVAKLSRQIEVLSGLPEPLGQFSSQAREGLVDLRNQLYHQKDLLEARLASCPTTNANVGQAIGLMFDASIQVVDSLAGKTADQNSRERLDQLRTQLLERKAEALLTHLPPTDRAGDERLKYLGRTPGELAKQISRAVSGLRFQVDGGGPRAYSAKELGKMLSLAHCEALNAQPWTTVSRTVKVSVGAGQSEFVSDLRPATTLNPTLERTYGGRGVCCHSTTEAVHAKNLVRSELRLPGQDQPFFKALRHGAHCAYGLGGRAEREAANDARVNELLVAALCDNPELLERARAGEAVALPVTSVSLLTPDGWRKGSDNNETMYLREQTEAWRRASQEPRQLSIRDADGQMRLVTVRPQVLTFNFGVNAGAQGNLQRFAGGWNISTPMNAEALAGLIGPPDPEAPAGGAVGAFLSRPGVTAQRTGEILELTRQIKQLWNEAAYRKSGENPYLLPARILVLANMLGQTPAFNCKSGKDRTGQLDVEAKTLAARMHMLGRVPSLEESKDEDYKITREQMSINGGNHEIQRLNTGLAGFKTKGVSGLDAVYRGTAFKAAVGLSDYVHS